MGEYCLGLRRRMTQDNGLFPPTTLLKDGRDAVQRVSNDVGHKRRMEAALP